MNTKKQYTREDKIKYYQLEILLAERAIKRMQERLEYLMSDKYQDWNGQLAGQLKNALKKGVL